MADKARQRIWVDMSTGDWGEIERLLILDVNAEFKAYLLSATPEEIVSFALVNGASLR